MEIAFGAVIGIMVFGIGFIIGADSADGESDKQIKQWQDEAIKLGIAEWFLDEKHEKKFRVKQK